MCMYVQEWMSVLVYVCAREGKRDCSMKGDFCLSKLVKSASWDAHIIQLCILHSLISTKILCQLIIATDRVLKPWGESSYKPQISPSCELSYGLSSENNWGQIIQLMPLQIQPSKPDTTSFILPLNPNNIPKLTCKIFKLLSTAHSVAHCKLSNSVGN